jgi:iron complex outermembrane recepter protein
VCLLIAQDAAGQATGQVSGVIRDVLGEVLEAVTVTLTCDMPVFERRTVTDVRGHYAFEATPMGRCTLVALRGAFDPISRVIVVGPAPARADLELTVSALVERVTVTATKSGAEDVQALPVAVTVVPAQTLEQRWVESVDDLVGLVPTMTVSRNAGQGQVTIRGIGTNASATGADPSSTVHLDGVYLARPSMQLTELLDVERVEVLRGPQGTVYGRNSVGGTINIVSRLPTNDFAARTRVAAGTYGMVRVEGAVSGPLVKDRVMGSLAFLRGSRDGFVIDTGHPEGALGSQDTWAGRGQLRGILGRAAELRLSGDVGRNNGIPLTFAQPLAARPAFQIPPSPSLWEVRTNDPATGHNTQAGGSATLMLHLNDSTVLTSLTARRSADYRAFVDLDLIDRPLQTLDVVDTQRQFSQEVTLASQIPRLGWVGGAFFLDEHVDGPVLITLYGPGVQRRPHAVIDTQAWALFGEATYELSRRLSLTSGLRYSSEAKSLSNTGGTYQLGTTHLADPASFYAFTDRATFDAWTPRVSLQTRLSSTVFAYASASRGFKSGGFNPSWPRPDRPYRPEFAQSYESGLKSTLAGGRVQANVAAFHNDYRDLQVQSVITAGLLDITNAASATVRGVEIEATAAASTGVQVSAQLAWLDATYDAYTAVGDGGVPRDVAGNRLSNAPAWSGGGSAVWEFGVGRGLASMRTDVSWQSRVFFSPFNDRVETQELYALVQLRAAWQPRHRFWEFSVFVRNLGNSGYITGTGTAPVTAIGGRPGEPRQWGTQITVRR